MGKIYEVGINPISDSLLELLLTNVDISDINLKSQIYFMVSSIISYFLKNPSDIVLLDFEIKKEGIKYNIVGNNIISALWLSGIVPENPNEVNNLNEYIIDNFKFNFNKKTKKLLYKSI